MSSAVIGENSADVLLAEKTLEIIRVIELSNHILKAKFNDDSDQWMKAMFHILKLRNSEYLWEERYAHSESKLLCQKVHDNISRVYSEIEAQKQSSGKCDMKSRSELSSTSNSLIKLFRKFTNLLVKTAEDSIVDGGDVFKEMKLIQENITSFIAKYERENVKNVEKKEISRSEASAATPLKTPITGTTINNENNVKYSKPNTKDQIIAGNGEKELNFVSYGNPVFSTLNKKTVSKNVDVSASTSATQSSDNSSISKPSWRLLESDRSRSVDSLNKNLPINSLRKQLNSSLGYECDVIEILNDREFFCTVCKCQISALQNVITHLQGKPHSRNLGIEKGESKKQPTEGSSNAIEKGKSKKQSTDGSRNAIEHVGGRRIPGLMLSRSTSNDRGILQISNETIPIQRLEI